MDDFHIHTTYSDGTDTIFDILSLTEKFDMFSITDHNNINACKKVCRNNFVAGVEFSCLVGKKEIHLLGYNFDLNDKDINKLLDEYNYNNKIFLDIFNAIIKKYGFDIDNSEVLSLINKGVSLNKVNLSKILLDNNVGSNIYEVYENYVKSFLEVSLYYPKVNDIINSVKQSNGYILLAHPYEYGLSDNDIDLLTRKLRLEGLDGIEVTTKDFNKTFNIIKKHGLIYSLGSDYHGKMFKKCNTIGIDSSYVDGDDSYIKNLLK